MKNKKLKFQNTNTGYIADPITENELRKAICDNSEVLRLIEAEAYRLKLVSVLCAENL